MAFRASNVVPDTAYKTVRTAAVQLKANCQAFVSYMAANDTDYDYLRNVYVRLKTANTQFTSLKSTPGLAQYAKDQEIDQNYDVVAEFNAMQSAIADVLTWMDSNVPTNVTADIPANWESGGSLITNTFTPAQTSALRTEINAVIAAIT